MFTIYKYPLEVTDTQLIEMPYGAEILTVQTQNEIPCIWAKVDKMEKRTSHRLITMYGTGNPITRVTGQIETYLNTFQLQGGSLVFHVFEVNK